MIDHQDIEDTLAEKAKDDAHFAIAYAICRVSRELTRLNNNQFSIPQHISFPKHLVNINRPPSDAE